jgi:pyruvate ferredoxin oxidoreductase beta subunit
VATACPSYPWDLLRKVQKAAQIRGPAYLHVLSVCPIGWRILPQDSIEMGKLAVQTRIFPLYEVEHGRYRLVPKPPKAKPVSEYLKRQGRFRHLTEELISRIQQRVDEEFERLQLKVKMTRPSEETP